ncbi:hypothetical protein [Methylorubrum sp. SB2]|uniref:hypothetical protein n=1 Tax=Methylorubrum subtropicum TaxID=3138812 RepID=UPI00313C5CDC
MTWFGTIVCHNPRTGQLLHRPIKELCDDDLPVLVEDSDAFDTGLLVLRPARQCRAVRTTASDEHGSFVYASGAHPKVGLSLKRDDKFLSARPGGSTMAMMPAAKAWEAFVVISKAELDFLDFFQGNDWWRRSDNTFLRAHEIALLPGFKLKVGSDELPVPRGLPSAREWGRGPDGDIRRSEAVLFFDGWRIEAFQLFRPLVFVVAYGPDEIFERLHLCLRSLFELGRYEGDVLVIGDKSHRELSALLPRLPMDRIHVQNLRAVSSFDYYSARYYFSDWESAHLYQPFLYMDLDAAVDCPVMPFFEAVAFHDKLSFQAETWTRLDTHIPAGSALVRNDPGLEAHDLPGFNSGIFTVPSLTPHEGTLRKIREAIRRYLEQHGPKSLSHFDQPIVNYVTVKLAPIDYAFLTPRVRYTQNAVMVGGDEPLGFVHFWGNGPELTDVMARFIEETARKAADAPA